MGGASGAGGANRKTRLLAVSDSEAVMMSSASSNRVKNECQEFLKSASNNAITFPRKNEFYDLAKEKDISEAVFGGWYPSSRRLHVSSSSSGSSKTDKKKPKKKGSDSVRELV